MTEREHWESIYRSKGPAEVSWYRPHLDRSLKFIDEAGLSPASRILDVGGGGSTLVDDLLERGYTDVTVLDVSQTSIAQTKARLGARATGAYMGESRFFDRSEIWRGVISIRSSTLPAGSKDMV